LNDLPTACPHLYYLFIATSLQSAAFMGRSSAALKAAPRAVDHNRRLPIVSETFGFSFAEDAAGVALESTETGKLLLGEKRLKELYVETLIKDGTVERSLLSEDYPLLTRTAEMGLLTKTAEAGILTALTEKGLTLSQVEKALPIIDDLELIPVLIKNKWLFLNLFAPLLVEPAPLLLGPLAGIIKVGGLPFIAISLALIGSDVYGVANGGDLAVPPILGGLLFGGIGALLG
jgi:hypothetical protein